MHDDVIKWKHFPHYWPFIRGIHRWRGFPSQRTVTRSFNVFFDLRLNKHLSIIQTPVIWDAIALIMTSLQCILIVMTICPHICIQNHYTEPHSTSYMLYVNSKAAINRGMWNCCMSCNHHWRGIVLIAVWTGVEAKKSWKIRITDPLCGEFIGWTWFPQTGPSYAEKLSISWRHYNT